MLKDPQHIYFLYGHILQYIYLVKNLLKEVTFHVCVILEPI